jgi:hypothetical protein
VNTKFHPILCPMCWNTKRFMPRLLKDIAFWNSKGPIYSSHSWSLYPYISNKILIKFYCFVLSICIFFIF